MHVLCHIAILPDYKPHDQGSGCAVQKTRICLPVTRNQATKSQLKSILIQLYKLEWTFTNGH